MRALPEPVGTKNSTFQFFPGGTTWLAGEEVPMMPSSIAASSNFKRTTNYASLTARLVARNWSDLVFLKLPPSPFLIMFEFPFDQECCGRCIPVTT